MVGSAAERAARCLEKRDRWVWKCPAGLHVAHKSLGSPTARNLLPTLGKVISLYTLILPFSVTQEGLAPRPGDARGFYVPIPVPLPLLHLQALTFCFGAPCLLHGVYF